MPGGPKSKPKAEDGTAQPLSAVGIGGPTHLREALTNCTDPLQAIEEFQVYSLTVHNYTQLNYLAR